MIHFRPGYGKQNSDEISRQKENPTVKAFHVESIGLNKLLLDTSFVLFMCLEYCREI